jgi:hypothetical protein
MTAKLLFCGGLLIVSLVSFISRRLDIPDFWHGVLIGAGIGMEIIGGIKLIQLKKAKTGI